MDNQRLFLFVALGLVVIMLWQSWQEQYTPTEVVAEISPTSRQEAGAKSETVPVIPEGRASRAAPVTIASSNSLPKAKQVYIRTDLLDVTLDSAGGDIRVLRLLKYPTALDKPNDAFPLLTDDKENLHVAQSGLIGPGKYYPNHEKTVYRSSRTDYVMKEGKDSLSVPLVWKAPNGVTYTKTYIFHRQSYVIDVEYSVLNRSRKTWYGHQYAQFRRRFDDEGTGFVALPTFVGGVVYGQEDLYEKISFDDMSDKALKRDQQGGWVAMMQHYFIGAWLPDQKQKHRLYTKAVADSTYIIGYTSLERISIEPGATGKLSTQIYVGPKEPKRLEKLPEGMDLTVDYGWLTFLSAPLYWLLSALYDWLGNWGWAIIVLTILIKIVFFPLSAASYKSMARMKKVQPKLKALKEKYGDDKTRLNQAMMEIYKTEKINPLGGCLPILIQIPVFIALYWVLLESVEMRQAPFILWIKDLSAADPYFILPLIMGASMFAQHWLNPAPMDPMQQRIMMALPAVFTIFFLFFPSGLVLYWVVNNLLSIAQQWQINRMIKT